MFHAVLLPNSNLHAILTWCAAAADVGLCQCDCLCFPVKNYFSDV